MSHRMRSRSPLSNCLVQRQDIPAAAPGARVSGIGLIRHQSGLDRLHILRLNLVAIGELRSKPVEISRCPCARSDRCRRIVSAARAKTKPVPSRRAHPWTASTSGKIRTGYLRDDVEVRALRKADSRVNLLIGLPASHTLLPLTWKKWSFYRNKVILLPGFVRRKLHRDRFAGPADPVRSRPGGLIP